MFRKSTWRRFAILEFSLICYVATLSAVPQDPNWQQTVPIQSQRYDPLEWKPPSSDSTIPSLDKSAPCDLAAILDQTGRRETEFGNALKKFTAQESIEYRRFDPRGELKETRSGTFDYTFAFEERDGGTVSQEYRAATKGSRDFSEARHDVGQVALALIFDPSLQPDYQMSCEGAANWQHQRSWVIRFEQRKDRPNHIRTYMINGILYHIRLRGRAWIRADTSQIVRMETDIAEPVAKIKLRLEHMQVEYRPVTFPRRHIELWLPHSAELYMDFLGHRFYRRHYFSNFELFSVETKQKITVPEGEQDSR